ncbi:MAG: penicillin-binding protein 2 [Pseudobdellovibrionaceae bacterium]|nr:penicillin-binding protein 2 [Bdellovibrionales bacterium]USN48968.1 MAG: penicillin-binding protein 2 [Pseudobdellovibrionaceae bacterium]
MISTAVIFSRLWYLQIIKGHELSSFSEKNLIKAIKRPAERGLFLDRDGQILVENLPGYNAVISPQYAKDLPELAKAMQPVLKIPADTIVELVKKSRRQNGPFRNVVIKENLTLDEVIKLNHIRFEQSGLDIEEVILRHYPLKENGAQLLGYVGEISKSKIQTLNKKYADEIKNGNHLDAFEQGDIVGKNGLERVWEAEVRGRRGLNFVEVDARGRELNRSDSKFLGLKDKPESHGHNLVLTLDRDLQEAAYLAMQRQDHIGPRIGALVAMKSNGEILAWVNTPSFDPNEFSLGISQETWSKLVNDPNKPLRNKVIQDHYAPGSTIKPIIASAALQEKVIEKNTVVFAPGSMRYGRRTYHDSLKGGHGNITVREAIERSSNIFFYKMGIELGIDNMAKYASLLGLGQKTDLQVPNEVSGLFPTSKWKLDVKGEPWQPGENLSNAIGQGFVLTTLLQMAVAYNAIGLEGKVYKPYLVKKIISRDNKLLAEFQPEMIRDVSKPNAEGVYVSPAHLKTVKEGMWAVANGARGTARYWKIPGVEMAGKTGTSQVMSFSADQIYNKCEKRPFFERHHGSYVGFAPADKPEITVAVLAEHSCHGSTGAAPIVRDVIQAYMEKYHPERTKSKSSTTADKPLVRHDEVPDEDQLDEETITQ